MSSWKPSILWGINTGQPIKTSHGIVTPKSRSLQVRLPFGGFVWNHPVEIELVRGGDVQTLKIDDITRKSVLIMAAVTMIISLGALFIALAARLKN